MLFLLLMIRIVLLLLCVRECVCIRAYVHACVYAILRMCVCKEAGTSVDTILLAHNSPVMGVSSCVCKLIFCCYVSAVFNCP